MFMISEINDQYLHIATAISGLVLLGSVQLWQNAKASTRSRGWWIIFHPLNSYPTDGTLLVSLYSIAINMPNISNELYFFVPPAETFKARARYAMFTVVKHTHSIRVSLVRSPFRWDSFFLKSGISFNRSLTTILLSNSLSLVNIVPFISRAKVKNNTILLDSNINGQYMLIQCYYLSILIGNQYFRLKLKRPIFNFRGTNKCLKS